MDLGCGYGPIGLALAKKNPQANVEMVDVNELALDLAKQNAALNGLRNVNIHQSNIYDKVQAADFTAIITNPPIRAGKDVVHTMLTEAKEHLATGGMVLAVLQKKQGAPSAKKKMTEVYGNCQIIAKDKGYYILQSIK